MEISDRAEYITIFVFVKCCRVLFVSKNGEKEMRVTTSDLYESTYYLCNGASLLEVNQDLARKKKVYFLFDDESIADGMLGDLQNKFIHGQADVNLSQYLGCLERIKDKLFAATRRSVK